jgi:O-antigen ligase
MFVLKEPPIFSPAKYAIPGTLILPLIAVMVAVSCSRYFGLPDIDIKGVPQLTLERALLVFLWFYVLVAIAIRKHIPGHVRISEVALWSVCIYAAISSILKGGIASGYSGAGITIWLNLLFLPAILFSILLRTRISAHDMQLLLLILTLFGLYLSMTALIEHLGLRWALIPPEIGDPSIAHHWGRARGPFLQAEFNGAVMVQLMPVAILLGVVGNRLLSGIGVLTAALLCVGTYFTYTRAALGSLIVVVFLGMVLRGRQRVFYLPLGICVAIGMLVVLFLGGKAIPRFDEMDQVMYDRLNLLGITMEMIKEHPLGGIGFGRFDILQTEFFDPSLFSEIEERPGKLWEGGTHNTLLTPLAELGVIVGLTFVALVIRVIVRGIRITVRDNPPGSTMDHQILIASVLIGIAYMINAVFVELRYILTPNALFWVFAAFIELYSPPRTGVEDRSTEPRGILKVKSANTH